MAPASPPASSPALPWAAAAAVAPTQPPVAEEEATPADFLTEAEQAAAVATSVQAGAQLEVLWEVDGEEQGWTWWPASVEEPSSSAAHPPHTWRIRYEAQHGHAAEDALVTFGAPGHLTIADSESQEPLVWRHAPVHGGRDATETGQSTVTLSELAQGVDNLERLMGTSLDERLAEQLKGMPMHKQQLMVDGFRQWASFMSSKLKDVRGTVEASDIAEAANSFRREQS